MLSMESGSAERLDEIVLLALKAEFDQALPRLVELAAAPETWGAVEAFLGQRVSEATLNEVELIRRLGAALAQREKFNEALACWRLVEELCPEDRGAAENVSRLTIAKSRHQGEIAGRKTESASPPVQRGERKGPVAKPQPDNWYGTRREVRPASERAPPGVALEFALTPIQQFEQAVRNCPAHPDYYLKLVPLYLEKGRDYDAEKLLAKARTATGDDPAIRRLWEDVQMLRLAKKVTLAEKLIEVEDTPKSRADLADLVDERGRLESEIFHSRCQREPKNAALRYELGLRLKRAGNLREAFQRFEEALPDAAQRCAAAFEMGECQRQFQEFPEALRYYRMSAESASGPRDSECQKRALHQAAKMAAQIKLPRVARQYLTQLLQLDPNCLAAAELLREFEKSA